HPPATSELYTLSLHDALPIFEKALLLSPALSSIRWRRGSPPRCNSAALDSPSPRVHSVSFSWFLFLRFDLRIVLQHLQRFEITQDRKSTRLNSSHDQTSYAVF